MAEFSIAAETDWVINNHNIEDVIFCPVDNL